jgi:enoyl-[acyl-carrier-protein] reductase (NADH)
LNREHLESASALGRLVRADEVAAAIRWLLSDEASGITGANLPVDAGFLVGVPWQAYGGLRAVAPDSSG